MTQSDREIKTISQKTVARDFSQRDILSEGIAQPETSENMTRREAFKNLLPSTGRGLAGFLRSFSLKLNETFSDKK